MDSSLSQAIAETLDTRADGIGSCSTDPVYIAMRIYIQDQRRRHLFRLAGCIFQKIRACTFVPSSTECGHFSFLRP